MFLLEQKWSKKSKFILLLKINKNSLTRVLHAVFCVIESDMIHGY